MAKTNSKGAVQSSSCSNNVVQQIQLYALVEWVGGPFVGTYSHNIRVEWIRNFNSTGPFDPLGCGVEWRVPPMPRLGWNVYDAKVLEVSDDLDYLKRKEDLATQDRNDRRQSPTVNNNNDPPATPAAGNDQNGLLHQILGALRAQPQQQLAQPAPQPTPTAESVQVVKIGESLVVPKTCIIQAKAAKNPSAMTMYLVKGTFSKKRLQRSVYAGQRRRGLVPKPSLKKFQVMRDIQDYVLQRFPEFSQSSFGAAVNSCTGLKATATPEVQYEEMVPSDEENE